MKLTALQKQAIAEHSQQMQQAAIAEKEEVINAVLVAAEIARKANAERQAAIDAAAAERRAQFDAERANLERQEIRARNLSFSDADFDRLFPQLRDAYLLQRSREQYIATRAEYSTIL